jgi:hypothetical protein
VPEGENTSARRRDQTARDPAAMFGGSADRPFHVKIVGANDAFYEAFRTPGGSARPREERRAGTAVQGEGFEGMLADAQAVQAASRQAARNLQLAADAAQQFTRRMTAEGERQRRSQQNDRVNVEEILLRMERMAQAEREERRQDREREQGDRNRPRPGRTDEDTDTRPYPTPIPLDEDGDGTGRPPDAPGAGGGGRPPTRPPRPPRGPGGGGGAPPAGDDEERPGVGPRSFAARVQQLQEQRAAAHRAGHTSTGSLQARARMAAGEYAHERWGEGTSTSPTLVAQHDDNGVLTHYNQHHPDGSVERIETDDARVPGLVRTAGRMAAVSGASSALAAGGFMAAAKAVPVVGTAIAVADAANSAAIWLTEQRAKNAEYQAVYGGTNLEGIGGRLSEEGFMWGQRLDTGMTEDQSRQLFKGVTSMGYSGSDRSDRLDFAVDAYKEFGMSVSQSLGAISLAAKSANSNFAGLQRSLRTVTLAARSTGQSAEVLRDQFLQTYAGLAQAGLGTASSSLAAGLVGATSGTNRQFDQINTSGVGNTTALRIAAAQTGQTYGQLLAGEQQGDTELARTIDTQTGQAYSAAVGPQAQNTVQQGIAKAGGNESVQQNQGSQHTIALDLMKSPDWDSQVVAENLFAMTGGQIDVRAADPTVVAEQYVAYQAGTRIETQQKAAQAAQNPKALTDDDRNWGGIFGAKGQSKFVADHYESDMDSLLHVFSGSSNDDAVSAYEDRQNTTNQTDPVIEDLISNYADKSDVGYEVQTKDGKRTVSLADAIQYYPDQLAKGTATIVGGSDSGKAVSDAVGYAQKDFTPSDGGSADSTKSDAHGKTKDEWLKDNPTDQSTAAADKGKITIEATDELKKMFNFTGQGVVNSQVEAGATGGVPPAVSSGPR